MDVLQFENPVFFNLFFLVLLFVILFVVALRWRKATLKKLGTTRILERMAPMRSFRRPWLKLVLFILAISSVIMAMINPMLGLKTEEVKREGIDIIIALDVSRSMLAEDIRPNRLDRSKLAVSRMIDQLENDRVGIVAFAGSAATIVPLTSDHDAARMLLRTVNTESVQTQGTAIGRALERSIAAFGQQDLSNKVIVLVSDGENHLDDPMPLVQQARREGVRIHTIGVGTLQGSPIPVYRNNQLSGFFRDQDGNTVISRFDEEMLRKIASEGGGIFQTSTGADLGLNRILQEIRSMETQEYEAMQFSDYESRFHYFVALALIFLLLDFFIFERRSKWLDKIQFFK